MQTLTENEVWYYYTQRNMWAKGVEFDDLKAELRKKGVTILEKKARYTLEDGQYVVFIESENNATSVIVMPDGTRKIIDNNELEDY